MSVDVDPGPERRRRHRGLNDVGRLGAGGQSTGESQELSPSPKGFAWFLLNRSEDHKVRATPICFKLQQAS